MGGNSRWPRLLELSTHGAPRTITIISMLVFRMMDYNEYIGDVIMTQKLPCAHVDREVCGGPGGASNKKGPPLNLLISC